jgi:nucleotidyltransferase/DNA polymerase involved in DNA repair
MSTWMRFTRPSNTATTQICAANRSPSEAPANVAAASAEVRHPLRDAVDHRTLQIRRIFAEYSEVIEPLSLDEAYLDVTKILQDFPLARDVALQIRATIKAETGLNASAGISYNNFLAKLASDHRKPNGQFVITPEMGPAFVETLPAGKFLWHRAGD